MLLSVTQRAAIWVPFLAFALLYTLFFICTGLATWNPKLWNEAKSRLLACGRRRKRGGAAAAAATPKSPAAEGDAQAPAAGRPRSAPAAPRAARPAVLTWQGLGCEYNTHEGVKAVLQVRPPQSPRPILPARSTNARLAASRCTPLGARQGLPCPTGLRADERPNPQRAAILTFAPALGPRLGAQDVSGEARPKEMVALMGPSGSGKSTLIDMLAARKSTGRLSGDVRVNGRPRTSAGFRRISSYVPQVGDMCAHARPNI
jgi:ABC-type multidrug transport system fused ATPase/permease subunit